MVRRRGRYRAGCALLIGICAASIAVTGPVAHAQLPTGSAGKGSCAAGWEVDTIASGLTKLENLESDGNGGFYISGIEQGFVKHVDAQGEQATLATGLKAPAGIRRINHELYFVTGDGSSADGSGTLERLDLRTGERTTVVAHLVNPNGLLLLPDGDLLITQLSLPPVGISRYRPSTGQFTLGWSKVPFPNGLALSADRKAIYTESELTSEILRIPLDAPNSPVTVAIIRDGLLPGLDDMDSARDGKLFVGASLSGSVYQIDTATGDWCTIATGWRVPGLQLPVGPTSVRIARDGDRSALFVVGADGTLRRMRPPAGFDLAPAFSR